jgi:hypothetical protein
MALAYLDPAAVPVHVSSPNRSGDLQAGSRALLPTPRGTRPSVDLLAIAQQFATSAPEIHEIRNQPERSWVLLAATDLFEAWAIGWPPRGSIELHDHGQSLGAVVVADGELVETSMVPGPHGLATLTTTRLETGSHRRFGPHYIHDLGNDGYNEAVSVHVYGPRLTSMTYYAIDATGRLAADRTERVTPVGPFDTTSDHDPS